jgi:hypothetical protein
MQRRFFAWVVGTMAWLALCCPSSSSAQSQRVVVLEFQGRGAPQVRGDVVSALGKRSEVEVVSLKEAESARQRLGVSWGSAESYQRVGAELGVAAFVEGNVQKAGKKWKANVRVRDASTGLVSSEETWARKSLPQLKAVEGNFWQALGPAISSASVPPGGATGGKAVGSGSPGPKESASAPAEKGPRKVEKQAAADDDDEQQAEADEEAESEPNVPSAKSEGQRMHPALVAWAGPRLMWRDLSYDDEATDLSTYQNTAGSPAFNLAAGAQWYPGARSRSDWLSDIGIEADIDASLGLKSKQGNKEVKTTAYELSAGLVYRLPLDSFVPHFRIGYVKQVFEADVPKGTPLPNVNYSSLRFGLGTQIFLMDALVFDVNAAYLYVLDAGDIGSKAYAPDLSTFAFEVSGGLVGYIKQVYGIRAGVDFRRYAFDFGDNPGGMFALPKSGADHYTRVTLSFVYRLAGKSN